MRNALLFVNGRDTAEDLANLPGGNAPTRGPSGRLYPFSREGTSPDSPGQYGIAPEYGGDNYNYPYLEKPPLNDRQYREKYPLLPRLKRGPAASYEDYGMMQLARYGEDVGGRAPSGNALMSEQEREHPIMSAARRAGADPDALLQQKDLRGLIGAAIKGNPQLGTDQGSMMVEDFANAFKRNFNMTERELPNSRPPGHMPNAMFGPSGLPRPLQRPQGYE
jgi:hypothetical protein